MVAMAATKYGAKIPNENLSKMPATLKESAQARLLANTPDKEKAKIIQEIKIKDWFSWISFLMTKVKLSTLRLLISK